MKRLIELIMSFFLLLSIGACNSNSCSSDVNDTHRQQWAENGSSSYVIKSSEDDFAVNQGTFLITVNDGKITSVEIIEAKWFKSVSAADFPVFESLTIEGMFNMISEWPNGYQDSTCSSTYDPKYGYPTSVEINLSCTDCLFSEKATLISLLPSSTMEP
jgi:hypothetical protein